MTAIKTVGLTKRYKDVTAVDGLDLEIEQGELFALLGVNGAGKSTTIKMLSCLVKPSAGAGYLNGVSLAETGKVKGQIGISPQETAVAPNLSVVENLALMWGAYGLSGGDREEKIARVSQALGLTEQMRKRAGKLSGGWQRRLSIAMALIGEPKILFLDEPTLGLDVLVREELWSLIRALKGKITIVLTTHYMEEAEALSDRIGIMQSGKLIALGSANELKARTGEESFERAFIKLVKEGQV